MTERAVLTRAVCRELAESDLEASDRRPQTALYLLSRWISETQAEHIRLEARAGDGLTHMVVPDGHAALMPELVSGARVCNALFQLYTADTQTKPTTIKPGSGRLLATVGNTFPTRCL